MPIGIYRRKPIIQRFLAKVKKTKSCWNWTGADRGEGYGRFRDGQSHIYAHRWSYEQIPEGLTIDHLCRNRMCVNPKHLEPVTIKENVMRGVGIAAKNASKTHCKRGHEFNIENTYIRKNQSGTKRRCRTCRRIQAKQYRQKKIKNTTCIYSV